MFRFRLHRNSFEICFEITLYDEQKLMVNYLCVQCSNKHNVEFPTILFLSTIHFTFLLWKDITLSPSRIFIETPCMHVHGLGYHSYSANMTTRRLKKNGPHLGRWATSPCAATATQGAAHRLLLGGRGASGRRRTSAKEGPTDPLLFFLFLCPLAPHPTSTNTMIIKCLIFLQSE